MGDIKLFSGPGKRVYSDKTPLNSGSGAEYVPKSHIKMIDFETLLSWNNAQNTIETVKPDWSPIGIYSQKQKSLKFL